MRLVSLQRLAPFLVGLACCCALIATPLVAADPTDPWVAVVRVNVDRLDLEKLAGEMGARHHLTPSDSSVLKSGQGLIAEVRRRGIRTIELAVPRDGLLPLRPRIEIRGELASPDTLSVELTNLLTASNLLPAERIKSRTIDGGMVIGDAAVVGRDGPGRDAAMRNGSAGLDADQFVLLQWNDEMAETLEPFLPSQFEIVPGVTVQPDDWVQTFSSVALTVQTGAKLAARVSLRPRGNADIDRGDADVNRGDADLAKVQSMLDQLTRVIEGGVGDGHRFVRDASGGDYRIDVPPTWWRSIVRRLQRSRRSAMEAQRMNDLKQVVLANYNWMNRRSKSGFASDIQIGGQPTLSWRVSLLPFLDQAALHETIDLRRRWDDPANVMPASTVVQVYSKDASAQTVVRIPVLTNSHWLRDDGFKLSDIVDGLSNTIAFAIAPTSDAVPWMRPGYWQLDEANLVDDFFGDRDEALVGFFDGSVRRLQRDELSDASLRGMLTIDGKESIK